MPYRHLRPHLYEFSWEAGDAAWTNVASSLDEAFDKASAEAASRGLHDEVLRCVDQQEHDPSGGDGPED